MVEILAFVAHGFVGEGESDGSTNERRSREENGAENPLIWGYIWGRLSFVRTRPRQFADHLFACEAQPPPTQTVGIRSEILSIRRIFGEHFDGGPLRKQGRWELPPPPTRYLGSQSQLQGLLFTKVGNVRLDQKKKQKQKRARNVSKAGVTAVK